VKARAEDSYGALDAAFGLGQARLMTDRVRLEPVERVRVRLGGELIADTQRAFVVHEQGLPPRYYVPRDDVRAVLQNGQGAGTCPWKGRWHHLDVGAHGRTIANGAWTYFEPTPVCEPIRDFVAFYAEKMDAIEVG
jgi:uncharacterized protein (DUF427 family)